MNTLAKVGRNDPCPCGSGKKYKKCCIDKEVHMNKKPNLLIFKHLTYEEVDELSTNQIISKLEELGIPFEREQFIKDTEEYYSAEDISEAWFDDYDLTIGGKMEDFPWLAACVLWERLAKPINLSMEQLHRLIEDGNVYQDKGEPVSACNKWLQAWEGIKYRIKPVFKTSDYLHKHYRGSFFLIDFCQELEFELFHAGLKDRSYFEKRIEYCQEYCSYFPNENELIIFNMRRAIAESYGELSQFEQAESEFEKLAKDFNDNLWSYIAWGDYDVNKLKAKEKYEKALAIGKATKDPDVFVAKERLDDLEDL